MMRRSILPLTLLVALALPAVADEKAKTEPAKEKKPAAPEVEGESPLARAARLAQESREGKKAKVSISDEDLKRTGGRLTISSGNASTDVPARSDAEELRLAAEKRAREQASADAAAKKRLEAIREEIRTLERELGSLEVVAHDEDEIELSAAQAEVASRYQEKVERLAALRKELAAATASAGPRRP